MYKIQLNEHELEILVEANYPLYKLFTDEIISKILGNRNEYMRMYKTDPSGAVELKNETATWLSSYIRNYFDGQKIPHNVSQVLQKINGYANRVGNFWNDMLEIPYQSSAVTDGHGSVSSKMRYNTHPDDAMQKAIGGSKSVQRGFGADSKTSWANKDAEYSIGEKPSEEFGSRKHSTGVKDYEPIDADYIGDLSDEEFSEWIQTKSNMAKSAGIDEPLLNLPQEDKIGNKMAKELMSYYRGKFNNDAKKAIQVVKLMYNNGKKNNEFKQFNSAYKKYIGDLPLYSGNEYSSEYNHTISNEGVNYMLSKDIFNSLINEADDIEVNIDADDVGDLSVEDEISPANDHSVGEDDSSYFVQLANDIMMSDDRYSMNTLQTVWEKKGILAIEHIYSKVVGDLPLKDQLPAPQQDLNAIEPDYALQSVDDMEIKRLVSLSRPRE